MNLWLTLAVDRGLPELITVDNGPEFAGMVLDAWAYTHGVQLHLIDPGKPVRMPTSRASTGVCATNASTSIGS